MDQEGRACSTAYRVTDYSFHFFLINLTMQIQQWFGPMVAHLGTNFLEEIA